MIKMHTFYSHGKETKFKICIRASVDNMNFGMKEAIDHFRILLIWPGDRIRRPEHPTENEASRRSCDESV